jgi:dephospho-CoA kinase
MLRAGLTGGIGCGKSTVAAILRELGLPVVDADPLAHAIAQPGQPAYQEILEEFGAAILDVNRGIDRAKLAAIVFSDPQKLSALNRITHPRVLQAIDREVADLAASGQRMVVIEAALLIEANYHEKLERLVVVWCRPEQQRERLRERGMTAGQVEARIAAQMPLEAKRRLATDEIDNSATREETRAQTARLAGELRKLAGA